MKLSNVNVNKHFRYQPKLMALSVLLRKLCQPSIIKIDWGRGGKRMLKWHVLIKFWTFCSELKVIAQMLLWRVSNLKTGSTDRTTKPKINGKHTYNP